MVRVCGEARKDERKWEALWSYRANPPTQYGDVVPFDAYLGTLGLGEAVKAQALEVTDEEIERLMKAGRMGWIPPRR